MVVSTFRASYRIALAAAVGRRAFSLETTRRLVVQQIKTTSKLLRSVSVNGARVG